MARAQDIPVILSVIDPGYNGFSEMMGHSYGPHCGNCDLMDSIGPAAEYVENFAGNFEIDPFSLMNPAFINRTNSFTATRLSDRKYCKLTEKLHTRLEGKLVFPYDLIKLGRMLNKGLSLVRINGRFNGQEEQIQTVIAGYTGFSGMVFPNDRFITGLNTLGAYPNREFRQDHVDGYAANTWRDMLNPAA